MYPMIPYSDDPLLIHYASFLRQKAIRARLSAISKIEYYQSLLQQCFNLHPELVNKIKELVQALNLTERGVPDTEGKDHLYDIDSDPNPALRFLVKRAYREAVKYAHPDHGGDHDDFVALTLAARSNDLGSISEFLLSLKHSVLEQIAYWDTEQFKPEKTLKEYQATPEFKIVSAYITHGEFEGLAKQHLLSVIEQLTQRLVQSRNL